MAASVVRITPMYPVTALAERVRETGVPVKYLITEYPFSQYFIFASFMSKLVNSICTKFINIFIWNKRYLSNKTYSIALSIK